MAPPQKQNTVMKRLLLFTVLCLSFCQLPSQNWRFSYHGDFPLGRTHFLDGFVDEDGVTFLVGQEGPDNDHPETLIMRIEPNGMHSEIKYHKEGFYSKATCITEMNDHNLFVAGNLLDEADDYIMVLIFDKQLNLLEERQYAKEIEALSFGDCKCALDSHGNVIVATTVIQDNPYQGTWDRGVMFKFNAHGDIVSHRYLIEEYPDPFYFFMDFHLRQMWYKNEDESLLCLAPGYGNVMSFITLDSAFNYIEEYPIWRIKDEKIDHTLNYDCYTDHWYSEEEALFFSSRGDYEHNKLRISRVNTQGEFLEYIFFNERGDTIDDAAWSRCMATVNDSTFYFSTFYHTQILHPGIACVYLLNKNMEIIGRHIDDDHNCYRAELIFPTSDGGCITVHDSCSYQALSPIRHPVVSKLTQDDFTTIPWTAISSDQRQSYCLPYPNPTEDILNIPLKGLDVRQARCQVYDHKGCPIIDVVVNADNTTLHLDVSRLKTGIYHYKVYSSKQTLLIEKFIKK